MPPSYARVSAAPSPRRELPKNEIIAVLSSDLLLSNWADTVEVPIVALPTPVASPVVTLPAKPIVAKAVPMSTEDDFYAGSWGRDMEWQGSDHYTLDELTEEQYADCMRWLYAHGWHVYGENRAWVDAIPDTLPPRVWVPPNRFESAAQLHGFKERVAARTGAPAPEPMVGGGAPAPPAPRRKAAMIPIFCVKCAAAGSPEGLPGCKYTHGDTIARVNEPCKFGCDCAEPKRSLCIRMHPGETWTEDMVIRRPVAAE
jgi:hypothetical protein